jgi:hypothetical protein
MKQKLPVLTIKRIKEQSFFIDEVLLNAPPKAIRIEFGQQFGFVPGDNLVGLTLRIFYFYPSDPQTIVAEIKVQNIFEVASLKTFVINEHEIKLPKETITAIVGGSISHATALLAKNLSGTILQETLPSITDPKEVAHYFFPKMFA